MKIIDDFLNSITMYKLVLYYLIGLLVVAFGLSLAGTLSFNPLGLLFSVGFLLFVCWVANNVFARVFEVVPNAESVYISALILALIINPPKSVHDLAFLGWAATWAMAGKYILTWKKKHFFNPVALGVFLPALFGLGSATWWVGTASMLVPVLLGGLLVVRKIRRGTMVSVAILAATLTITAANFLHGPDLLTLFGKIFLESPILFFAFVMLTEPSTTPPTKNLRLYFAILVGFLFAPQLRLGILYTTPEGALLLGNIFAYVVSSKERLSLILIEKKQIATDTWDFVFQLPHKFNFSAGQYLEWTLGHPKLDSRGNRRYFTIASSPTENELRLGVKFYEPASSFKKALRQMNVGDKLTATSLAGDFTLPKDKTKKLVFIAGGIGITPFRSQLKYLLDTGEKRNIIMFYANKTQGEIVYQDILGEATNKLGTKVIYTLSDTNNLPANWTGKVGRITSEMISQEVPDYKERFFYLSGPHSMVDNYVEVLKSLKVPGGQIITDYFPGFA